MIVKCSNLNKTHNSVITYIFLLCVVFIMEVEIWCWKYGQDSPLFSSGAGLEQVEYPRLEKKDLKEIELHKKYSEVNDVKVTINRENFLIEVDKDEIFIIKEQSIKVLGISSFLTIWFTLHI